MRNITYIRYLWVAAIIYSITAYFSLGHMHPDEYHQILEFAAYKLGISEPEHLPWEFYAQIRPSLQPWIVIIIYKFIALFQPPNPFVVTFITRLISASLSLISVTFFIETFKNQLKNHNYQKWFIIISIFSWLAIYNSVRFSSENISAKLFVISLCLIYRNHSTAKFKDFISGMLLGMSFLIRFQLGIMIFGLLSWSIVIQHRNKLSLLLILSGMTITILFGIYLDYLFYGNFVLTPLRYFTSNLIDGKAAEFSRDPWYFYTYIGGFIPYGIFFILSTIYFSVKEPKNILTWVIIPFILVHTIISHKELRFLTPLMTYMPFLIMSSIQTLNQKADAYKPNHIIKFFQTITTGKSFDKLFKICWRINLVGIAAIMFTPSAMQLRINELLYDKYKNNTIMYTISNGGNILDFYKKPNLSITHIETPTQVACNENQNCLIALTCQETVKYGSQNAKLIYSDCPSWIFKVNISNWLSRTQLFNIYEIKNIESTNN